MKRLLPVVFLLACSSSPQTSKWDQPGQFGVGVHTFTFVDTSRPTMANADFTGAPDRTLVVEVWFPATTPSSVGEEETRDAPFAAGPFPLVVQSHGFMDSRHGEAYLGRHLASHGYVVAAPDYPLSNSAAPGGATVLDVVNQPGDLSFVIDSLLADAKFGALIDARHIGASGLSLGGLTTLLAGFHPRLHDARLSALLPMAAPSCMFTAPFFARALPILFLHGDADLIVPPEANSERVFPFAQDPRELILLHPASHTGFSGFASLFDPSMNYDRIGCMALGNIAVTSFSGLGTADEGISQDANVCPKPCQGTPVDPSLEAERQQQLTRLIALAFFEGQFRAKNDFLAAAVATENHEVTVRLK